MLAIGGCPTIDFALPGPGGSSSAMSTLLAIRKGALPPRVACGTLEVQQQVATTNLCPYGQARSWQTGRLKPGGTGATIGMRW